VTNPPPAPSSVPPGWYPHAGGQRYWDGQAWTEHHAPAAVAAPATNGLAIGALITGILGFLFMAIPFFIGWFTGGPLDLIAIILGIAGLVRANRVRVGFAPALIGLILGGVSVVSVFFGAGSIW
jgi:hypothetical protein